LIGNFRLLLKARNSLSEAQAILEKETEENRKLHDKLVEAGKFTYAERVARDTLGLARENEVVFILPPEESLKELSPRKAERDKKPVLQVVSPWEEWLKLFL